MAVGDLGVITPPGLVERGDLPAPLPDADERVQTLELALQEDIEVLGYPSRTWDYRLAEDVLEVAIIGGGNTGKSLACGLRRYGISNVRLFDQNPAGQEGPWRSYARNATLRTPKTVTGGMDWGIPNLNIQRWCVARYGSEYWQSITYIPRLIWAEYLDWYCEVLQLPLQNDTRINDITWDPQGRYFRLQADQALYKARFVILSAGIVATGGKTIPALVTQSLPAHIYAHTADDIDFSALANRRVMIIGGGASAFDNAIAALKAGASQVDITIRRPHLPNINRIRWSEWNGFHRHYIDLDAAAKWYYSLEELKLGQLPPPPTYHEAMQDPRLNLFTHAPLQTLTYHDGEICGSYGGQAMRHDFLICGTGFECKIWQQAELQSLSSKILLWKDHYQPDPGFENEHLANCPYLGSNLELQPRDAADDYLRRIYCLSTGTSVISGFRANLSSLQFVSPRVCQDISRQLFLEDQDRIRVAFDCYDVREY